MLGYSIVVASTRKGGIGLDGKLPWDNLLPTDLNHFRALTLGKTAESENKKDEIQEDSNANSRLNGGLPKLEYSLGNSLGNSRVFKGVRCF